MTNAEISFDDLLSFSSAPATVPGGEQSRSRRRRDLRAVSRTQRSHVAAEPPAVMESPVVESAVVESAVVESPVVKSVVVEAAAVDAPIVAEPSFDEIFEQTFEQSFLDQTVEAPAPAPARRQRAAMPAKPAKAAKPTKSAKRGEFYRPDLYTRMERFTGLLGVKIAGWTTLVAATGALAALALSRFS